MLFSNAGSGCSGLSIGVLAVFSSALLPVVVAGIPVIAGIPVFGGLALSCGQLLDDGLEIPALLLRAAAIRIRAAGGGDLGGEGPDQTEGPSAVARPKEANSKA